MMDLVHFCILLLSKTMVLEAYSDGDLQLVGSGYPDRGRIEIYYQYQWNTICDDNWDDTDAYVACKQLGYSGGVGFQGGTFPEGAGNIAMDEVSCTGSEAMLFHCPFNGWYSHDCTHPEDAGVDCIDFCHSNPCQNGGVCSEDSSGFFCSCPSYYVGTRCEIQNFCGSSPCKNGATCSEVSGTYSCSCVYGYTGYQCETFLYCSSSPCQNGGTCSEVSGGFSCSCVEGYTGTRCETEINECASNPCSGGICLDIVAGYVCRCKTDATRQTCADTEEFAQFTPTHLDFTGLSVHQRQTVPAAMCKVSSCAIQCQMELKCLAFKFDEETCQCVLIEDNVYRLPAVQSSELVNVMN